MMNEAQLQDRLNQGLGTAARAMGLSCDAYRAQGPLLPLAPQNRFLRLNAAFNPMDPGFARAGLPGNATWYGVFDAAYLQAGDYLMERPAGRIWFIAAMQPLLPCLCVLTNRVLTITRPAAPPTAGVNPYGGGLTPVVLVDAWPASMLQAGSARTDPALPADTRPASFKVLLPAIPQTSFRRGDMVRDDLGRTGVIAVADFDEGGWVLDVRQAAS